MCGLCGVLGGGDHWTDGSKATKALKDRAIAATRRRERAYQVRLANAALKPLGLTVADWQGASFILSNGKGASDVIDHLGALWAAAEVMRGKPFDPLDAEFIGALSAANSNGASA
jgi:hypothetical protein